MLCKLSRGRGCGVVVYSLFVGGVWIVQQAPLVGNKRHSSVNKCPSPNNKRPSPASLGNKRPPPENQPSSLGHKPPFAGHCSKLCMVCSNHRPRGLFFGASLSEKKTPLVRDSPHPEPLNSPSSTAAQTVPKCHSVSPRGLMAASGHRGYPSHVRFTHRTASAGM